MSRIVIAFTILLLPLTGLVGPALAQYGWISVYPSTSPTCPELFDQTAGLLQFFVIHHEPFGAQPYASAARS